MYQAEIENRGDTRYHATTRHGSFVMDTGGHAANPVDTLLASLCACVGHYVHDFLGDEGLPSAPFRVAADGTATADHARLASISVRIDLGPTRLAPAQERALLQAVEKCKIHGTLRRACAVEVVLQRQAAVA